MTVSIEVDLDAEIEGEIAKIESQLESLEEDLNLGDILEGDIGDKIDDLNSALDDLGKSFTNDLDEQITRLEDLELDFGEAPEGGGDSGGDTGSDSGDFDAEGFYTPERPQATLNDSEIFSEIESTSLHTGFEDVVDALSPGGNGDGLDVDWSSLRDHVKDTDFNLDRDLTESEDDGQIHGSSPYGKTTLEGYKKRVKTGVIPDDGESEDVEFDWPGEQERLGGSGRGFNIRKLIPSMSTWINLVGAAVPAMGAFAVQAAGTATAMGAVAAAGAGLIGLGLVGHGETMAQSFAMAKQQLKGFKKEVFQNFQSTAQQFAPISERFLNFAPDQLGKIADSMEGLTQYEDTIFSLFKGGTQWIASLIDMMVKNEDIVSQLTKRFTNLIGTDILNFFGWLVEEAYASQDVMAGLWSIFKLVASAIYNVFQAAAQLLVVLKPVFGMFRWLSSLLNNSLIFGLLTTLAVIGMVSYAVATLTTSIITLVQILTIGMIPGISAAYYMLHAYAFNALMATSASYALARSIATVVSVATMGLGTILGVMAGIQAMQGMSQVNKIKNQLKAGPGGGSSGGSRIPSGGGGVGGGGGQTTFKVYGDPSKKNMQGMKDIAKNEAQDYNYVQKTRKTPSFE